MNKFEIFKEFYELVNVVISDKDKLGMVFFFLKGIIFVIFFIYENFEWIVKEKREEVMYILNDLVI